MNNKKKLGIALVSMILCIASIVCVFTVGASAATTMDNSVNGITFIGFYKTEEPNTGKSIFAAYYIPDECLNRDAYTYGVLVFPRSYADMYNITDNYINAFASKGLQMLNIPATKFVDVTGGQMIRMGISEMKETNLDREFCFVLYMQDNASQSYAYGTRSYASYNSLSTNNQAVDLSKYRPVEEYNAKVAELTTQVNNLKNRVKDMEDSLTAEDVDMSKYKTVSEYNAKVAEMQTEIDKLKAENEKISQVTSSINGKFGTNLKFSQVLGITAGLLLLVGAGVAGFIIWHKRRYR